MLSVFFYKNRKVLAFLLLLIVSFTMMGTSSTSFTLNLKSIILTIIYPFEYVINGIFNFFRSLWEGLGEIETLKKELLRTQARLKKYEELDSSIQTLQRRNAHLERLLDERKQVRYEHVLASIVGKDPQNYYQSFIIDKGSSDGVAERMPVIAYENGKIGIVGRVTMTTPFSALVTTIRGSRTWVGAILEASRYYGMVRGNGMSAHCLIEYVDVGAPAKNGDVVVTSGHSDIYPRGLSIGILTNVQRDKGQFFLKAEVAPTINFAKLENVYVVKKLPSPEIEKLEKEQKKL
ncbi:MAG TPA: rod shape-determining protein MreC [Spirochaetota bacterium]|nr:rod shape-determining protein MreC [Spirochaetota bacterium]